ncbi:MAG: Acetate kinase [bacterium ADurb.Bin212]|nr:MAG: Acetate kinase [bacterium ADurb.Bin212]
MILVLNAGSSSLKYKLFELHGRDLVILKSGSVNDIGRKQCANISEASKQIFAEIAPLSKNISQVGHRIVFGGDKAKDGEELTKASLANLLKVSHFAPLHNPSAVATIKYFSKVLACPHYLFYDDSFYSTLPETERIIPIDQIISRKLGIQRRGFHGISHQYAFLNSDASKYSKVISIHIGAGSSLTAIMDGQAIATSMGLTPLGGICMLTRSGDIDPGVVTFLIKKMGIQKTEHILNKQSGLTGIMGANLSFFDILYLAGEKIEDEAYHPHFGNIDESTRNNAKLALDVFASRTKQFIGAYSATMGGVEALLFTGRAGAGSSVLRSKICYGLDYLNLKQVISFRPDEELAIANKIIKNIY